MCSDASCLKVRGCIPDSPSGESRGRDAPCRTYEVCNLSAAKTLPGQVVGPVVSGSLWRDLGVVGQVVEAQPLQQ